MKRAVVVAALVCVASMAFPARASAGLMDWLQELSGPGPFNAKYLNVMVDACPTGARASVTGEGMFASEYERRASDRPRICLFFDNEAAGDNFGAGKIDVHAMEFGASVRIHRAVSLGFGVGRINFDAKDRGAEAGRFLVTAPRIVLKPALLFGNQDFWDRHPNRVLRTAAGAFKFYIRNNIIAGSLTGADFGLTQGDANVNFAVRHDRVWSTGFLLDFSEVLAIF